MSYGQVLCLDYKGRVVSNGHCELYTGDDSGVKVASSCNSTNHTTACEEGRALKIKASWHSLKWQKIFQESTAIQLTENIYII